MSFLFPFSSIVGDYTLGKTLIRRKVDCDVSVTITAAAASVRGGGLSRAPLKRDPGAKNRSSGTKVERRSHTCIHGEIPDRP
jgi:hypothetical protein